MKLRRIEVIFPVDVEVSNVHQQKIDALLGEVCREWQIRHPGRVMWVFGVGSKILFMPLAADDDRPMVFSDDTLEFQISEREDYDWLCARCGLKQGDHASSILGGVECEFSPRASASR